MPADALILGPLLRYVDETSAAIWVETRDSAEVCVRADGRRWSSETFCVHGHHYALVDVDGLDPGSIVDYAVDIAGVEVWPPEGSRFGPSRIATLEPGRKLRLAFGSCRTSVPHDEAGNRSHGVDALRAYAIHMADNPDKWPDLIAFLGDQVYADLTSDAMQEFIESRRDINEPPGEELKDYEEYCHLYKLAWSDPANRWLLSTLPSSMIFDDHDIRDDWNTSSRWRKDMEATSWWHQRIVAGLGSYWVYQHLGNLSPAERAADEIWQQIVAAQVTGEPRDLGAVIDEMAARVDAQPDSYRWSHARRIGNCRLVVVDSRAARILQDDTRSILDDKEMSWLHEQLRGDVDHVFIGTSLPYLLSPGLHQLEAWNEAVSAGAWGNRLKGFGEKARRTIDLEHWAAFQDGFREVADMVCELADGKRGAAPATVHLSVRRRAQLLCVRGETHRIRRCIGIEPDPAGRVLADPQSASQSGPARYRFCIQEHGQGFRRPVGEVSEGARPTVQLAHDRRAVVRQQPGHARDRRSHVVHAMGKRCCRGRQPRDP
ncbi:MAG: alkaline phosphatase D family protein [Nocardioidaceae bacterium]